MIQGLEVVRGVQGLDADPFRRYPFQSVSRVARKLAGREILPGLQGLIG